MDNILELTRTLRLIVQLKKTEVLSGYINIDLYRLKADLHLDITTSGG